jgi:hypothetical protein
MRPVDEMFSHIPSYYDSMYFMQNSACAGDVLQELDGCQDRALMYEGTNRVIDLGKYHDIMSEEHFQSPSQPFTLE